MSLTLLLKRQEQNLLLYSEAYLEYSRTSMMELFSQKHSIVDARLGSKYASCITIKYFYIIAEF